jgi:hypothetical protein
VTVRGCAFEQRCQARPVLQHLLPARSRRPTTPGGSARPDTASSVTWQYEWQLREAVAGSPQDYGRRCPTWAQVRGCSFVRPGDCPGGPTRHGRCDRSRLAELRNVRRCGGPEQVAEDAAGRTKKQTRDLTNPDSGVLMSDIPCWRRPSCAGARSYCAGAALPVPAPVGVIHKLGGTGGATAAGGCVIAWWCMHPVDYSAPVRSQRVKWTPLSRQKTSVPSLYPVRPSWPRHIQRLPDRPFALVRRLAVQYSA